MTAWLLKNGVPFDVAESWPDEKREAYAIMFTEMSGPFRYDFERGDFIQVDPS